MEEYVSKELLYKMCEPSGIFRLHVSHVDQIPAADVLPVVRCKDCKYWKPGDFMCGDDIDHMYRGGGCSFRRFAVYENDFCSAGEKMDCGHKEC